MNLFEFIRELADFYPINESQEKTEKRINAYVDVLSNEIRKTRKRYDYKKVLEYAYANYKYKTFPSIPDILEWLPHGVFIEESYSGREGEVVKRVINGHKYEFTVVPNHWGNNVKTIAELDKEIAERECRA